MAARFRTFFLCSMYNIRGCNCCLQFQLKCDNLISVCETWEEEKRFQYLPCRLVAYTAFHVCFCCVGVAFSQIALVMIFGDVFDNAPVINQSISLLVFGRSGTSMVLAQTPT